MAEIPENLDLKGGHSSPLSLLPYDIVRDLCHAVSELPTDKGYNSPLKEFSRSNNYLRDVSVPMLFRAIAVRGDWNHAMKRLGEMESCPAVFEYVRSLRIVLSTPSEESWALTALALQLTSQLGRMRDLEKLVLVIPGLYNDGFASTMAESVIVLPHVRTLVVGTSCHFAVNWCPNAKTIAGGGYARFPPSHVSSWSKGTGTKLIRAAGTIRTVTALELIECWNADLARLTLDTLPDLQSFTMNAGIMDIPIAEFLPILPKFRKLQRLALPDVALLDVGFHPPDCGNAYWNDDGTDNLEFIAYIDAQQREAETRVATMLAPPCRNLTELWVGNYSRAEILRDTDGNYTDTTWHRGEKIEKAIDWLFP